MPGNNPENRTQGHNDWFDPTDGDPRAGDDPITNPDWDDVIEAHHYV